MEPPVGTASPSVHGTVEYLVVRLREALQRHDAARCAAQFTDNGSLLSPYGPEARGREAIAAVHQGWFDAGESNKRLDLIEYGASGDVGYCVLAWSGDYLQLEGSYKTESGKSVNVLRKQSNGEWLIHVCSLNDDSPSQA